MGIDALCMVVDKSTYDKGEGMIKVEGEEIVLERSFLL